MDICDKFFPCFKNNNEFRSVPLRRHVNQVVADGKFDEVGSGVERKFLHDVAFVRTHGSRTDEKFFGNLGV
jgi:uncharacterized CHY-type Zn-finger protein